jgi:predicted HTH transcriptional regulator
MKALAATSMVRAAPNGKCRRKYLARLFQQRSQARLIRFEEQPVPQSGTNDLSEALWRRYTTRSEEASEIVLPKRNLLSCEESGALRALLAGVLLCCERSDRFLPSAYIEAVRYRGTRQDSKYQTDTQKLYGQLDLQIKQVMSFMKRNQSVIATKEPHRVEIPQFSKRAVFEAIVNAVAHRYTRFSDQKSDPLCLMIAW